MRRVDRTNVRKLELLGRGQSLVNLRKDCALLLNAAIGNQSLKEFRLQARAKIALRTRVEGG